MANIQRSGFNGTETIINATSAPNLKVHWTAKGGGMIFSQPVAANGMVYWGSWNGYEHATDVSGTPDTLARIVRVDDRSSVLRRTADDTDPYEVFATAHERHGKLSERTPLRV